MQKQRKTVGKRMLGFLLALAMLVTMVQLPGAQRVSAAELDSVRLYFELPDGTAATDWCVNVWSNATVTEADRENSFRPSTWGIGDTLPVLLSDPELSGWGYVTISGSVDVAYSL